MSDVIRLLPDSVANQIAAGEVIQRPAAVIKELVENAVDAGATEIRIYLKDAGRTLVQVVDNGKGMSETDARMAFERHATSKISEAADLFALSTMGFRGEALPSICAISQVELKTRMEGSAIGTRLVINGSLVETQEPVVCDKGTNIMVKNLFFNTPARRKFLKSDSVETSNVMREFERLALVNNHIRMSIDTGSRIIDLRPGSFKQRIGDIWKNNLDLHLLPIDVDTSLIKINGFISRPEYARRRNPLQYLIVNGRNMRHPYFHKAIMNCYESLIASDTQPCYFLKFEVDPGSIDVNIHPTKNEIKFEYEQEIWPILQASVKAALGKYGAVPSIDFSSDVLPVDPLPTGEIPEQPTLDIPENYNPFADAVPGGTFDGGEFLGRSSLNGSGHGRGRGGSFRRQETPVSNWDTLYADFLRGKKEAESFDPPEIREEENEAPATLPEMGEQTVVNAFCMQHALKYIITSSREGLIIIDQHRAHVKILFEQYKMKAEQGSLVSQGIMFAETLTLDPEHREALNEVSEELVKMGFALEYDEGDRWRITAVPSILKNIDPRDIILRILESVMEDGVNYGVDGKGSIGLTEKVALVMARTSAIQRGKKLSDDEMEHIVGELFSLPDPAYTPNGNRVYCLLEDKKLEAMFRN
ncbi:MAG: DNA mismatch repair endonuclease MutL [Bacteroides sp.]|nr:DNA mismatch repair endonuclease MutL [Bacteroides sp.]